jgi:hypothetical protein
MPASNLRAIDRLRKAANLEPVNVLKNEVKDKDLQALMLGVLTDDEAAEMDPKS